MAYSVKSFLEFSNFLIQSRRPLVTELTSAVFNESNVDAKVELFYDLFGKAMSVIPTRSVIMKASDKPWLTPMLKLLMA